MSKKTKWVTVVKHGDLIQLGKVKIQVVKSHSGQTSLTVEAPQETRITKGNNGEPKLS